MLLPDTTDLIRLTLHKDQAWALGVIVAGAVAILTQGAVWWAADVLRRVHNNFKTGRHWW